MKPTLPERLLARNEDYLWEVFHENSKNDRGVDSLGYAELMQRMQTFHESLPYDGYPQVELPAPRSALPLSVDGAIVARASVRRFSAAAVELTTLATLLHYGYGLTRRNGFTDYPPRLRSVPSAGALYPLELYVYAGAVAGETRGVYHYNPIDNVLRLLRPGDLSATIAHATLYPGFLSHAALIVFITAVFERSTFKYGDRGYRYTLLEAGHVAQNMNLVAAALGLGCLNLGGFFDREIDDLLALDGVTHSTLQMLGFGARATDQPSARDGADAGD